MNGIIGAVIGSSIGLSYEIKKTRDYNFNMIYDKANPSDDSIAIIATADWLMNTNHTHNEYIDKLHYWCNKYFVKEKNDFKFDLRLGIYYKHIENKKASLSF